MLSGTEHPPLSKIESVSRRPYAQPGPGRAGFHKSGAVPSCSGQHGGSCVASHGDADRKHQGSVNGCATRHLRSWLEFELLIQRSWSMASCITTNIISPCSPLPPLRVSAPSRLVRVPRSYEQAPGFQVPRPPPPPAFIPLVLLAPWASKLATTMACASRLPSCLAPCSAPMLAWSRHAMPVTSNLAAPFSSSGVRFGPLRSYSLHDCD